MFKKQVGSIVLACSLMALPIVGGVDASGAIGRQTSGKGGGGMSRGSGKKTLKPAGKGSQKGVQRKAGGNSTGPGRRGR